MKPYLTFELRLVRPVTPLDRNGSNSVFSQCFSGSLQQNVLLEACCGIWVRLKKNGSRKPATRGLSIGMLHYGEWELGERHENEKFYQHQQASFKQPQRAALALFNKLTTWICPSIDYRSRSNDSSIEDSGVIPATIRLKGLFLRKI